MVQGIYFNEETRKFSVIESTEFYSDTDEKGKDKKSKLKKAALIGAGVLGAGALGYAGYKYAKNAPTRKLIKKNNAIAAQMDKAAEDRKDLGKRIATINRNISKTGWTERDQQNLQKQINEARVQKKELGIGNQASFRAMTEKDAQKLKASQKMAYVKAKKAGEKFDAAQFRKDWMKKNRLYSDFE